MGYCKGIKSEHFQLHVFVFLGKSIIFAGICFNGRYEELFRQIYLVSLPLFSAKRSKFLPLKISEVIEKLSFFLLISSFINFSSHDSVQDFEVCLLMTMLYFLTFLKVAISSAKFSDNKLILD